MKTLVLVVTLGVIVQSIIGHIANEKHRKVLRKQSEILQYNTQLCESGKPIEYIRTHLKKLG